MEQLEGLHACYHKHWWCRLQMYLYFKRCHTFCNVVTLLILVTSMIVGSAWKESFVMVALTAAATFVKGWSDFKKYPHKMDMCRFAYTTYEKTLIELRKDARAQGCLPFTKTIRLEISGMNIQQLNARLLERESL